MTRKRNALYEYTVEEDAFPYTIQGMPKTPGPTLKAADAVLALVELGAVEPEEGAKILRKAVALEL